MRYPSSIAAVVLMSALPLTMGAARAWDNSNYPNLKGQWVRVGPAGFNGTRFDPSKPPGRGQEAPLTPEYQVIFEANLADQAAGGQGTTPTYACLSPGMPRATNGYNQIEFVVTQDTTHILVQHINDDRRIFTDGRDWPAKAEPTFMGYSIGKWIDTKGAGRFDTLEVETRNFKGPRTFDSSGLPLHKDNQTIVKERFYLDARRSERVPRSGHGDRPCADASLDRDQDLSPGSGQCPALLDRDDLRGEQPACDHRQGGLHDERRRLPDARQEGPGAARSALLQAIAEVTIRPARRPHNKPSHGRTT